ncbi:MAG: methyltransferase FkbM family [Rhodocyclaceae bacterium]|nr:methyltransferase FkbM family [Rhodocyclaceae bacterium]
MNPTHDRHRPDLEAEDMASTTRQLERDLRRCLDASSIVLDIGANRGQFAEEILSIVPVKKIYSFEPVPDAFAAVEALSEKHPQVVPVKKAVSVENGFANFYVTVSDVGSSLLPPLPGQPSKWLTLDQEVKVETVRLDDFIREQIARDGEQIALLKSDAQGSDLDVLRSAGEFLCPASIKSILVEINFTQFYEGQQTYHEIFGLLDKAGYRMAWLYPHRAHDEWLWWADVLFIGK